MERFLPRWRRGERGTARKEPAFRSEKAPTSVSGRQGFGKKGRFRRLRAASASKPSRAEQERSHGTGSKDSREGERRPRGIAAPFVVRRSEARAARSLSGPGSHSAVGVRDDRPTVGERSHHATAIHRNGRLSAIGSGGWGSTVRPRTSIRGRRRSARDGDYFAPVRVANGLRASTNPTRRRRNCVIDGN